MKKSLNLKLFTTIFLGFVFMILGILITLHIYFNEFYERTKIDSSAKNLSEFANTYENNKWSDEELYRQMDLYASKNNVTITLNDNPEGSHESNEGEESSNETSENKENHKESESKLVLITTIDDIGNYFDFFISAEESTKIKLNIGGYIFLKGYKDEDNMISPESIDGYVLESRVKSEEEISFQENLRIIDIKKNLSIPKSEEDQLEENIIESGEIDGIYYEIRQIPYTKVKKIDLKKKVEGGITFNVTSSLQAVNETLDLINAFFPWFFFISVFISFGIALIYSTSVTKPILDIAKKADLMANMNFSIKLDERRVDELGVLSKSLNILSSNLKKSLDELLEANKKLKEDYDREIKQEQSRKEFIANASHELKTPLGIIKGYAEGIKDNVNEEERVEYIDIINDEIKKMDKLILEMLKISKYDSANMKISKEKVDMLILVNDIVQSFERTLFTKKLFVDIRGEFSEEYIDREKIQCAFLNLFTNAVKYSKEKSSILIDGNKTNKGMEIEIFNECKPFTQDQIEKIWDRFYKVDESHSKEVEGTGLGLAIVKSIFEAHEIEYGVYNRDNGVVFWFIL